MAGTIIKLYTSYRAYLRDAFKEEKKANRASTMGQISTKCGMSHSLLSMILEGERNLTNEAIHRLARALNLSPEDHEYFENLVHFEHATEQEDKEYYERKLKRLRAESPALNQRRAGGKLLAKSYIPALLVHLIDIERTGQGELSSERVDTLLEHLPLTATQKREARELLREIFQSEVGTLSLDDRMNLQMERLVGNRALHKRYLDEILQTARARLASEFENPECFFRAVTFSISSSDYSELCKDLKELFNNYIALASVDSPSLKVVQASVQIYPAFEQAPGKA